MSDFIPKIGGERMTFDGVPLRDGEEEIIFENHSLSWWRQFSVREHKENGTEPFHPKELTQALFDDWGNHFGYPDKLKAEDVDIDGAMRLCFAIVKNITDDIVDSKVAEINDWHTLRGSGVSKTVTIDLRQKAEEHLKREEFQIYLFGASPDAIIREAYRVAEETVKEYYEEQERQISAHIRKSGVTIKELVGQMRTIDIPDDEIPEWITHCTPQRMQTLKKIIKRLRKGKEEQE